MPIGHILHTVCPTLSWYSPAVQFLQENWPSCSLYLPIPHDLHDDIPCAYDPTGQAETQFDAPAVL